MNASTSLDDALTDDHVRLDGLLRGLLASAARRAPEIPDALDLFGHGLLRHMTWEERALFPALRDGADPPLQRNLESLVIDHDRLREVLASLQAEVEGRRWPQVLQSLENLRIFLEGHNRDEEKGAYTAADHRLSEADRGRLLAEWRALE